jgi:hypothetical protein
MRGIGYEMERLISLKRAEELLTKVEGKKVTKSKISNFESKLNGACYNNNFYDADNIQKKDGIDEEKFKKQYVDNAEKAYLKMYEIYMDEDRKKLISSLVNKKVDLVYLKSDAYERELLKLSKELDIEEEYCDFVVAENYLEKERKKYLDKGVIEYYPVVKLAIKFLENNKKVKEKSQNEKKSISEIIKEDYDVTIASKIKKELKADYSTQFVNLDLPEKLTKPSLNGMDPRKALVYSLRYKRYTVLRDEEKAFQNMFYDRLKCASIESWTNRKDRENKKIEKVDKKIKELVESDKLKMLPLVKILLEGEGYEEYEIAAKYEEIRVAFNETFDKFRKVFKWIDELYLDEEILRKVYIFLLLFKENYSYSESKTVQYKYLLKKAVNGKDMSREEKKYLFDDFFDFILLYLDKELREVILEITRASYEFVLGYIDVLFKIIQKWDEYELREGKRKIEKIDENDNLFMLVLRRMHIKDSYAIDPVLI